MVRLHERPRVARALPTLAALILTTILSALALTPSRAAPEAAVAANQCAPGGSFIAQSVSDGHPYLGLAYQALDRDRARLANLGALRHSAVLSAVAERHSAYMAGIGNWSDGDPAGDILSRVHAAGLGVAVYAGQNVVTANGGTVAEAIRNGEAFFAAEANGGGPHWDNITNPNHHYVGMGVALLGSPGNYTIYLTQVFSDQGDCGGASNDTFTPASDTTSVVHVGDTVHPSVDVLQLRAGPQGAVIGMVHAHTRLKVMALQGAWAQVDILASDTYGWVFAPFLTAN